MKYMHGLFTAIDFGIFGFFQRILILKLYIPMYNKKENKNFMQNFLNDNN